MKNDKTSLGVEPNARNPDRGAGEHDHGRVFRKGNPGQDAEDQTKNLFQATAVVFIRTYAGAKP